eukprot:COSAG01_NODE_4_length_55812_cov_1344.168109_39_plen_290_part_00
MIFLALFSEAEQALLPVAGSSARDEVTWLLCDVFALSRAQLLLCLHDNVSDYVRVKHFESLLAKRVQGMPLAYVLGHQDFCGHRYHCPEGVLIPRSETELLVAEAIAFFKVKDIEDWVLLECGCGTGVLSIELALAYPDLSLYAWDISPLAIQTSTKNAKALGVKPISFIQDDFFDVDFSSYVKNKRVLLLSNPPYIAESAWASLDQEVKLYEPKTALLSGEFGMSHLQQLLALVARYSWQGIFEIGFDQEQMILDFAKRLNLKGEVLKDLAGHSRVFSVSALSVSNIS